MSAVMAELAQAMAWRPWERLAMLWAYFDESGEHDRTSGNLVRLTLGGAIASAEAWVTLSGEWERVLARFNIPMFHMADFEARVPPFQGWEETRRRDLLSSLLNIADAHVSEFVGFVGQPEQGELAFVNAYARNASKAVRSAFIDLENTDEEITIFFAHHHQISCARIGSYFDIWKRHDSRIILGGFGNPLRMMPFQVADIVAYEISRSAREVQPAKERYPFTRLKAKMSPITFSLIGARLSAHPLSADRGQLS